MMGIYDGSTVENTNTAAATTAGITKCKFSHSAIQEPLALESYLS